MAHIGEETTLEIVERSQPFRDLDLFFIKAASLNGCRCQVADATNQASFDGRKGPRIRTRERDRTNGSLAEIHAGIHDGLYAPAAQIVLISGRKVLNILANQQP